MLPLDEVGKNFRSVRVVLEQEAYGIVAYGFLHIDHGRFDEFFIDFTSVAVIRDVAGCVFQKIEKCGFNVVFAKKFLA